MLVLEAPAVHLTYGLSIHPGETWDENFIAIQTATLKVRDRVAPGRPFGLGLRLGHQAADSLANPETLENFRTFLAANNLYVFTINGFPYGSFHNTRVKQNVYHPDWHHRQRLDYTLKLADILSRLLAPGMSGSISTVPLSYKEWIRSDSEREAMIRNLMFCVTHLADIRSKTGREIHLGLEPEPDCFLETTPEVISFFRQDIARSGRRHVSRLTGCSLDQAGEMINRHLGVCFDTCHMSLQFEDLCESIARIRAQGIRISKVQLSAALMTRPGPKSMARLREFCDPVYLHQVKVKCDHRHMMAFKDLPLALEHGKGREWRVHFHVPLYFSGDAELRSTASEMTPALFRHIVAAGCQHLEIETYTFDVLPENMKLQNLVHSVADEYRWVLDRFY